MKLIFWAHLVLKDLAARGAHEWCEVVPGISLGPALNPDATVGLLGPKTIF